MSRTLAELRFELRAARAVLRKLIGEHGAGYYTIPMWQQYIRRLAARIKAMEATNCD